MLSSSLQTLLQNRLRYLPEITGKALSSLDWPTEVIHIGHDQGLHMDEIEELQAVVLKSMTGLLPPDQFETNIISATAASPAAVEKIIQRLNEKVFEPIHAFVMNNGAVPPQPVPGMEFKPATEELDFFAPQPETPSSSSELILPETHSETIEKPLVPGDFESFFNQTIPKP
jgi:hypothetical protein